MKLSGEDLAEHEIISVYIPPVSAVYLFAEIQELFLLRPIVCNRHLHSKVIPEKAAKNKLNSTRITPKKASRGFGKLS